MPSKKKNPRTPNSKPDQTTDYSSPSAVSSSLSSPFDPTSEQLLSSLDEASAQFPSLISRAAFICKVADDAFSDSRGCKIWLSESAMVSSSISPGSLVSVSLSSSDKVLSGFPLSALPDECATHFGFDVSANLDDEPGKFFALATVFPSCKVLKNGVRLSSDLSHTLGCPVSGRILFVYPVKHATLSVNENDNRCISLDSSKDIFLSPVYLKGKDEIKSATMSNGDLSNEVAYHHVENIRISSPKTPSLSESKVSSLCSVQSRTSNFDKLVRMRTHISHASIDTLDTEGFLRDDSSRKLLETCVVSWLSSRSLLSGNYVVIPVLSKLCVFHVGSKRLSPKTENFDSKNNGLPAPDQDLGKDMVSAFSVDWGTKIHLGLPENQVVETSVRSTLAHQEKKNGSIKHSTEANFLKLGGLSKEFAVLKDIILSSAVQVTVASWGLRPTKGVLLHGPPGTGKTTLARECAHDARVKMFCVNGPEIISQYHGETEQALHEVFGNASKASPSVVFIDELDAIAPVRKDGGDELSQRMVATLLNLMDGVNTTHGVLIIAATNRLDSIEPALRRPGRFDREIEIGVPSPRQRHEILLTLLSEKKHSLSDKDIQDLAMATHGFVGADLAALCNEAALVRLRQYVKSNNYCGDSDSNFLSVALDSVNQASSRRNLYIAGDRNSPECLGDSVKYNLEAAFSGTSGTENSSDFTGKIGRNGTHVLNDTLRVTSDDFEKARKRVRPSAMREVNLEIPKVRWEDVGGQIEVKMQLMEAVLWPQKHRDAFNRIGIRPPSGILLFGPPGCSKTLLARAVASEAGLNFLAVKGPELFSKWVGESEKAVRSLFAKARANAPSIIFFDEIDGLAITRGKESDGVSVGDRVISQLLVELDGLQERGSVTVIAATNRPDKIDPALLRPGRFDRLLYVGPPKSKDREDIFRVHLLRMACSSDVCISELSRLTEGYTGADISLICREGAIKAIDENQFASEFTMKHLKFGIQQVQPSDVGMYDTLSAKFQRLVHSTAKEDDLGCSNEQSHTTLWNRIRSTLLFPFRLILQPGSS